MSDSDLDAIGRRAWEAIDRATREGKSEIRELGRFFHELAIRTTCNPCLRQAVEGAPCAPAADNLRRCTLCGFIVDVAYAAEKPAR